MSYMGINPSGARKKEMAERLDPTKLSEAPHRDEYTVAQLAEVLGFNPQTIRDWCRKGKIGHVVTGKGFVISYEAVREFMVKNHG